MHNTIKFTILLLIMDHNLITFDHYYFNMMLINFVRFEINSLIFNVNPLKVF